MSCGHWCRQRSTMPAPGLRHSSCGAPRLLKSLGEVETIGAACVRLIAPPVAVNGHSATANGHPNVRPTERYEHLRTTKVTISGNDVFDVERTLKPLVSTWRIGNGVSMRLR